MDRLTELLSPLAERNGHRKGDGGALLEELLRVAGIDQNSIAKKIASISFFGGLVAAQYLESLPKVDTTSGLAAQIASSGEASTHARLTEQLRAVDWASLAWLRNRRRRRVEVMTETGRYATPSDVVGTISAPIRSRDGAM